MIGNKIKIIITLLVIILIGVFVWRTYFRTQEEPVAGTTIAEDFVVESVPQNELPSKLPQNIPQEEDAPIIRNEIIKVSQGVETQYLRTYYSAKSVEENVKIFRDFLAKDGWKIVGEKVEENFAVFMAKKESETGDFKLTISENNITGDVTVEYVVTVR